MEYLEAFEQHLMLVIVSLAISFVLAIVISYLLLKLPRAQRIVENLFGAIYCTEPCIFCVDDPDYRSWG